ncbi:trimethylamine---corrinoid protein Co-methyltransferase [Desulfocicer vacuolatum DSM 3385]|uniref:Methyltransferase n=2 Tax=Desulfocicer vacuolatum TaxID=2298 RepID=A0A1W2A7X1_9BACT|nr:trimethylamine---corrinoid protein Co-methyltransferase [Desulfocicer vacuolatum DSM 3385]
MQNRLQPLTGEQIQIIHNAAMRILNRVGVAFKEAKAIEIFKKHGFKTEGEKVFFEESQIFNALKSVPSEFIIQARNPGKNIKIGGEHFAFGPAWAAPFVIDPDGTRRTGTLTDQKNFCKLLQTSPYLDFAAGSIAIPAELTPKNAATKMLEAAFTLTDMPLVSNPCCRENGREITEMASIVFGKPAAELDHPISIVSVNPLSPLSYADDTLQGLIEFAQQGQALLISSMVLAGITGPINIAGTAALEMAESLSGIVLAQLINPGVPCVCGGTSCASDMRTGGVSLGGPESLQLMGIATQMAAHYGLPCRYGGNLTDSFSINAQSGIESALLMATPVLSGTHFIHQACGILGSYAAVSFEKFIIDEEVCGMIKKAVTPLEITDEVINTDLIERVGPGGSFMMQPETAMHCRTAFFPSKITRKCTYEEWEAKNNGDMVARATAHVKERIDAWKKPDMDPAMEQDLKTYVNKKINA